jgi:predicted RNA binding protein YcfA (HicA-like mRNA interferase family)
MPKLPRVSGAQIVRALERLGFVAVRRRGSHVVMRRGRMHVPDHREVKLGTLVGILKQAGVEANEFEAAHRG